MTAAVIDNAITGFGGEHSQGVDREVFSYDLTKQQWRKSFEWQTPRHSPRFRSCYIKRRNLFII